MPEPAPSRRGLSMTMILSAIVGLVIPVAAIVIGLRSCTSATVRAQLAITGERIAWKARPGGCAAEADGHAITLATDGGVTMRALLDPVDGPRLELSPPDQPLVVLTPATCPGLHLRLTANGRAGDGSAILDGAARARCPVPAGHPLAGAAITVEAWWKGCRLPTP